MQEIEVMAIGSSVYVRDDIKAKITGISIRGQNSIRYECSWWDGRTHICEWMEEIEVEECEDAMEMRIGFSSDSFPNAS